MKFINTAYAQSGADKDTAEGILIWFIDLINDILVPALFALAFLLFLWGVFRYFFGSGKNAAENRQEGAKFILWALIAFAVMISVWGLVNVIVRTFGFENEARPCLPTFKGPCTTQTPTGSGT